MARARARSARALARPHGRRPTRHRHRDQSARRRVGPRGMPRAWHHHDQSTIPGWPGASGSPHGVTDAVPLLMAFCSRPPQRPVACLAIPASPRPASPGCSPGQVCFLGGRRYPRVRNSTCVLPRHHQDRSDGHLPCRDRKLPSLAPLPPMPRRRRVRDAERHHEAVTARPALVSAAAQLTGEWARCLSEGTRAVQALREPALHNDPLWFGPPDTWHTQRTMHHGRCRPGSRHCGMRPAHSRRPRPLTIVLPLALRPAYPHALRSV